MNLKPSHTLNPQYPSDVSQTSVMTQAKHNPSFERIRKRIRDLLQQLDNASTVTELHKVAIDVFHDVLEDFQLVMQVNDTTIATAKQFMITHLHEGLTVQMLAKHLGFSTKYCSEWFRIKTGKTFSAYHTRLRLRRARTLLAHRHISLPAIADALGFHDQFAFSRFFKKATGSSPTAYRGRLLVNSPAMQEYCHDFLDDEYWRRQRHHLVLPIIDNRNQY